MPTGAVVDRPWWTVEDAARVLRLNPHTLYRLCRSGGIAARKVGNYWRIPAEALGFRVELPKHVANYSRSYHHDTRADPDQLELDLDPRMLVPVKVWRNTGKRIEAWSYEHAVWRVDERMNARHRPKVY